MDIRKIDLGLSIGPQIQPEDIKELAKLGFKSIISNRPDRESADQPAYEEIQKAGVLAGLSVHHIPVVPSGITSDDIQRFSDALDEMPGPIFAYCRTGTRAAALWALSAASKGVDVSLILKETTNAGFDISGMTPMLNERAKLAPKQ